MEYMKRASARWLCYLRYWTYHNGVHAVSCVLYIYGTRQRLLPLDIPPARSGMVAAVKAMMNV